MHNIAIIFISYVSFWAATGLKLHVAKIFPNLALFSVLVAGMFAKFIYITPYFIFA